MYDSGHPITGTGKIGEDGHHLCTFICLEEMAQATKEIILSIFVEEKEYSGSYPFLCHWDSFTPNDKSRKW